MLRPTEKGPNETARTVRSWAEVCLVPPSTTRPWQLDPLDILIVNHKLFLLLTVVYWGCVLTAHCCGSLHVAGLTAGT